MLLAIVLPQVERIIGMFQSDLWFKIPSDFCGCKCTALDATFIVIFVPECFEWLQVATIQHKLFFGSKFIQNFHECLKWESIHKPFIVRSKLLWNSTQKLFSNESWKSKHNCSVLLTKKNNLHIKYTDYYKHNKKNIF